MEDRRCKLGLAGRLELVRLVSWVSPTQRSEGPGRCAGDEHPIGDRKSLSAVPLRPPHEHP